METPHNIAGHETPVGHETEDAQISAVVITGAVLAISAVLVFVLVYGIFRYMADHPVTTAPPNPMSETDRQEFPPAPRIEEHPAIELKDLHSQEDRILTSYGWTDKKSGIVHIPIDRAMQLELERGFPARKEAVKQ